MSKTSTKEDGRPGFYWYPKDWMADTGLQMCSLAARGLWTEMINLMWLSPKRGYLLLQNSNKPTNKGLAALVKSTEDEVKVLLDELAQNSVFSKDENDVIFCRKIVDLEHIRRVRSEAGLVGMSKRYKKCYNKNLTRYKKRGITDTEKEIEKESISFNLKGRVWEGITEEDKKYWKETYPACNIEAELKKAGSWLISNPTKKKSQYTRFINNWLNKCQDSGGTKGYTPPKPKITPDPSPTPPELSPEELKERTRKMNEELLKAGIKIGNRDKVLEAIKEAK